MTPKQNNTTFVPNNDVKVITKNNTKHILVTGDCRDVLKLLPEESIDLIITDPPYNVGLDYGVYYKDNKSKNEYYNWSFEWLRECARLLSKPGSFYLINYPEINARTWNR